MIDKISLKSNLGTVDDAWRRLGGHTTDVTLEFDTYVGNNMTLKTVDLELLFIVAAVMCSYSIAVSSRQLIQGTFM
jgi:hypothetical protein